MNYRIAILASLGVWLLGCSSKDEDPGACFVARRVDQCCSMPIAVTQRDLDGNPCLQLWDRAVDVKACPAAEPCNLQSCQPTLKLAPWTRIAERRGSSCVFKDECATDADCMLAQNKAHCCACAEWVPRELVAHDACYVPQGQTASAACASCVDLLECSACPATPTGTCVAEATWRKCL